MNISETFANIASIISFFIQSHQRYLVKRALEECDEVKLNEELALQSVCEAEVGNF